ncbi:hypothetical protein Pfo_023817 [Paulownia fortunei]|nr:hypothetical protein Pfo_023817 [Paulownia fortunei]
MASSSSSSSCSSFSKTLISPWRMKLSLFILVFLLMNTLNSCIAIRPGRMMIIKEDDASVMALKYFQEKEKFPHGLYFSKLPKGVPIPPSGPSKRHNSSPQN